jgi:sec-independent protein translocase protein TatA
MGIPSGFELIVLLAVLVLLFGAAKLPTAARSIGQSIRIFKAETRDTRPEEQASAPPPPQQSLPASGPVAAGVSEPRVPQPRVDEAPTHHETIR